MQHDNCGGTGLVRWRHAGGVWRLFALIVGVFVLGCGANGAEGEVDSGEVANATLPLVSSQPISGRWDCAQGTVCQDVYDIDLPASTDVTLTVRSTSSTIRLGAFAPGKDPGSGDNLLTGNQFSDRRCSTTPATDTVTFRALTAGRYRIAFVRDTLGSPAGGSGTYNVTIAANQLFDFRGLTIDNQRTDRIGSCIFDQVISGDFNNCSTTANCQDVYDISMFPGPRLTFDVGGVTGATALRLAVFGQFTALSGTNLLTGLSRDRQCTGQDQPDNARFVAVDGGVYHFVIGRDGGLSAGGVSRRYTAQISLDAPSFVPTFMGRTVNDGISQAGGIQCGYTFQTNGSWSCGASTCQNTYDFDTAENTAINVSVTNVTGNSVPRMSVLNGNGTVNRLNSSTTDHKCSGRNGNDFASTNSLGAGRQHVNIGRDAAGSLGRTGNYTVQITTADVVLSPRGQPVANGPSIFSTTTCP